MVFFDYFLLEIFPMLVRVLFRVMIMMLVVMIVVVLMRSIIRVLLFRRVLALKLVFMFYDEK